jgi:glycosyltransferase involved in cell wall biosynthesis
VEPDLAGAGGRGDGRPEVTGAGDSRRTSPLRVVLCTGPFLEEGTARFATLLQAHPDVHLLAILCQSPGLGVGPRLRDLWHRRRWLAIPLAGAAAMGGLIRWAARPSRALAFRRARRALDPLLRVMPDLHAPGVLEAVRAMGPDLGLIYGGPILRPELFRIPTFGTLGIHHGEVPRYRGKKTTFWALHHGESHAGVTIQRVNAGVDTGEVVRKGDVPTAGRGYGAVWRDVEALGFRLYLEAILAVRDGTATFTPQEGEKGPLFRDPGLRDLAALPFRRRRMAREGQGGGDDGGAEAPGRPGRIVFLTESYHPLVGGGETQTRALAGAFLEEGRSVTVVTRRWDPLDPVRERLDGVEVVRIPPVGRGQLKRWGLLRTTPSVLRELGADADAFLVSGFRVLGVPAVREARRGRKADQTPGERRPRVFLKADSTGEMSGAFFGPGLARFGLTPGGFPGRSVLSWRNRILRQADGFVAISSTIEEELRTAAVPPDRIHRIPNGVDVNHFRPPEPGEREALRRELGISPNAEVATYAGRLVSYKGLPVLLKAWRMVRERHPSALLLLLGSGGADLHNCEDELRREVAAQGMEGNVRFEGATDRVAAYLRASDLFVFPSELEAFGIAVVEAMSAGLPVIATRVGGLQDMVTEDAGCLPVPPGNAEALADALGRLLSDADLRFRMGCSAREAAVSRYSLTAVRDAWHRLLDGDPRPGQHPHPGIVASGGGGDP